MFRGLHGLMENTHDDDGRLAIAVIHADIEREMRGGGAPSSGEAHMKAPEAGREIRAIDGRRSERIVSDPFKRFGNELGIHIDLTRAEQT